MSRVGIFAGSFDPVHQGHVEFALATAKRANLDKIYFLVEAQPRHKSGLTHLAHRLAMLKLTLKSHTSLAVLDFPDRQFSVAKTLPRLNHRFPDDELFLIVGSDVLEHLPDWPLINSLVKRMGLIIGRRQGVNSSSVKEALARLQLKPQALVLPSPMPRLSSRHIREALLAGNETTGLDPTLQQYIKANWLYASPSNSSSAS